MSRERSIRIQRDRLQIALLALVSSGRLTRQQVFAALRLLPKDAKDIAEWSPSEPQREPR